MRITSKYDGRCKLCGEVYRAGDEIDWEPGKGAAHTECTEAQINEPMKPDDPKYVSPETVEKIFAINRENAARLRGGLA